MCRLSNVPQELSIKEAQDGIEPGTVDPALWQVESLNRLELRCGLKGAALGDIYKLKKLITIVVSGNVLTGKKATHDSKHERCTCACSTFFHPLTKFNNSCVVVLPIPELPDNLQTLTALKHLECESNELTALPQLPPALEVLKASRNKLTTVSSLTPLEQLVTLDVSFNELASLDCSLSNKTRLNYINTTSNPIIEFSGEVGQLGQLASLIVNSNQLATLPNELGDLKVLYTGFASVSFSLLG